MARTFFLVDCIPFAEMLQPKYSTADNRKVHLHILFKVQSSIFNAVKDLVEGI